MKIEIIANIDDNFKIDGISIDEKSQATETLTQEVVSEELESPVPETPAPTPRGPKAVPLENPRSTRMSFFDGTSWDDGKRGVW